MCAPRVSGTRYDQRAKFRDQQLVPWAQILLGLTAWVPLKPTLGTGDDGSMCRKFLRECSQDRIGGGRETAPEEGAVWLLVLSQEEPLKLGGLFAVVRSWDGGAEPSYPPLHGPVPGR